MRRPSVLAALLNGKLISFYLFVKTIPHFVSEECKSSQKYKNMLYNATFQQKKFISTIPASK